MKRLLSAFLFKQGVREVLSLWKQFLAIIAIGAIAVTLFVGLQANADSLQNRVNDFYRAGNLADSYVTVNPLKGEQHDGSRIREIVGDEAEVESRFYAFTRINTYNAYCAISPSFPTISKPVDIVSGEGEENEDYLIVDRVLCSGDTITEENHLEVGSPAQIEFDLSSYISGGLIDGDMPIFDRFEQCLKEGVNIEDTPLKKPTIALDIPVTGVMNHPENVLRASYSISVFLLSSSAFAKAFDAFLERYFTQEGIDLFYAALSFSPLGWDRDKESRFPIANQFLIKGNEGFDVESANKRIDEYFDGKSEEESNLIAVQKKEDTSFASVMATDVIQARQLTFVFPFVFFAVAVLVILTTMRQLILKERTQIGTLKALGLSKLGIMRYYASITSMVVGIGVLIGEILGPIIIPLILDNKYTILYNLPKTGYTFPVLAGLLTAATFLFLANLVSLVTVYKEAKLLPVESMRPAARAIVRNVKSKQKKQNKASFAAKMAFRNIKADLPKSIMVVIGVLGCTALLCCGFGIDDTIDHGINNDPIITNTADMSLILTGEIRPDKVKEDLCASIGEDSLSGMQPYSRNNSEISYNDKSVTSFFYVVSDIIPFGEGEGKESYLPFSWDPSKVLLTKKIADRIGAKAGDTITFSYGNRNVEAEVDSIRDIFYSNGVYFHASSAILEDRPVTSFSSYYLELSEKEQGDEAKKRIESDLPYCGTIYTSLDYRSQLKSILSSVSSMTTAVKVFAILLAIVVLYNISVLNFTERTRDIATMKVLGFNKVEIASSLLLETMTLTSIGVALGLLVGWPFLYLVMYINQVEIISYPYIIYGLSYFLAFFLTFGVAIIINAYLASRSGKVKMVESLKSVE